MLMCLHNKYDLTHRQNITNFKMKQHTLILVVCVLSILNNLTHATITDLDRAQIDAKLSGLAGLLTNNYNYLQSNIDHVADYTRCTYNSACPSVTGWPGATYPPIGLIPNPFYGNESVNTNDTVVKIMYGTTPQQAIINEICFVESQKQIWVTNLAQSRYGSNPNITGLTWQYYGGESTISVFNPGFKWDDNDVCPGSASTDYDPKNRPWYVSATSSQKNIIVVIDLSDTLADADGFRMNRMRQSVSLLLNGLSYRDFVGILTYTEYSKPYISRMLRATIDNINALNLYVASLVVVSGSKSNIGNAFQSAYAILIDSIADGLTSNCNNIFFVVSSGANDITTVEPIDVVKQNIGQNVIVFSNIYSSDSSPGSELDLAEVSCFTKGNLLTVKTDIDASNVVNSFNTYMGTATYNQVVRWSEPYDDAVDGIRLTTGSLPIYKSGDLRTVYGVTAVDIDMQTLLSINQNLTELDIRNHLISSQTCPPLEITDKFLSEIQNPDTCKTAGSNPVSDPDIVKNKPAIVFASVVIAIIMIVLPFILIIRGKSEYIGVSAILSFCMFVLSLWALCVLWVNLFPEIVRVNTWEPTTLVTEKMDDNPYRCCDVVNCRSCEEYNGPSCSSMLSSLQAGPCQSGYHCCQKNCYTCNCYTSCTTSGKTTSCHTYCSTCCYCAQSVDQLRCDTVCGTCWNAVVTKSFRDTQGNLIYGYIVQQCSRDNRQCVDSFFAANGPIGKSTPGYYNPYNNNEIATDISYNSGIMAAFLIPMSLILLIFIGIVVVLFVRMWREGMCTRQVGYTY